MSVQSRLWAGLILLILVMATVVSTALKLPYTGWTFSLDAEQQLLATPDDRAPQRVSHFLAAGEQVPAHPHLAFEEPDVVPTYVDFNQLMAMQTQLNNALQAGDLALVLDDGSQHLLNDNGRPFTALPGMFWLQLGCGTLGLLICLLVLAPRPDDKAVRAFAITGFSYLLFTCAASIYSTRELLIDGSLFRFLSFLNHTGAMLFSAALTSLLWNYPTRIGDRAVDIFAYSTFVLCMFTDTLQWTEGAATGSYIWVFGLFLFGLLGSGVQWWKARRRPLERGAVRWMLLSIYAGTFFFAGGILVPAILQIPAPADQGLLFTTFLLMYAGLALGVIRYRLFQLERWWFSIWAWFLGGVAVVIVDLVLASMLTLTTTAALALATAIVGWLYFPVRQWLWQRIMRKYDMQMERWLPRVIPHLVSVSSATQLAEAWDASLRALFDPLMIDYDATGNATDMALLDDGTTLRVPAITGRGAVRLQHAHQGRRLFTRDDLINARSLLSLFNVVRERLIAREQGAHSERDRIRRDIHDDLGAKLLTMLHRSPEESQRQLVRDALNDLRELLRSMETGPVPMKAALETWEQEARQRCEARNVNLDWNSDDEQLLQQELTPEQFSNLTRVLRESITNSLRHATPETISVTIQSSAHGIQMNIDNDGVHAASKKEATTGRGIQIIRYRTEQLGGFASIAPDEDYWRVMVSVPLR